MAYSATVFDLTRFRLWRSATASMGSSFSRMSRTTTKFHPVSLGFVECYGDVTSFTERLCCFTGFYLGLPSFTEFYQDLLSEMVVRCFEMVSGWRGSCPAVLPSFFLPGFGWRSFEWRLSLSAAFVGCAFGARRSAWDVVQDGAEGRRSQRKRNEKRNKITIHAAAIFTPFNVPLWLGLAAREEARDCTEFFCWLPCFSFENETREPKCKGRNYFLQFHTV